MSRLSDGEGLVANLRPDERTTLRRLAHQMGRPLPLVAAVAIVLFDRGLVYLGPPGRRGRVTGATTILLTRAGQLAGTPRGPSAEVWAAFATYFAATSPRAQRARRRRPSPKLGTT